jgi:hypothetical protein
MGLRWELVRRRLMNESSNREIAEEAFRDWQQGTAYISVLLADDLRWTIVGRSRASGRYPTIPR